MLDRILSIQTKRTTNKNLIIKHHNVSYQICNVGKGHRYINQNVTVCEKPDGNVVITCRGKNLNYNIYGEALYKPKFANRRDIDLAINNFHFLMHRNISTEQSNAKIIREVHENAVNRPYDESRSYAVFFERMYWLQLWWKNQKKRKKKALIVHHNLHQACNLRFSASLAIWSAK